MKFRISLFLISFMLINPVFAKAEQFLDPNSELTYFGQLIQKFNEAKPITDLREILGWNAGRCYEFDNPQKPLGNLLIGQYADEDNGPMFPAKNITFFIGPSRENVLPANRWDNPSDEDKDLINDTIEKALSVVKKEKKNGEWVSWEETEFPNTFQIRKLNSYYVALIKINFDVDHVKYPNYKLNKGDVAISCYFFKKVK
ncbi:MAG: hypothetical protein ACXVCP_09605 [Bdellovibrio sp.]